MDIADKAIVKTAEAINKQEEFTDKSTVRAQRQNDVTDQSSFQQENTAKQHTDGVRELGSRFNMMSNHYENATNNIINALNTCTAKVDSVATASSATTAGAGTTATAVTATATSPIVSDPVASWTAGAGPAMGAAGTAPIYSPMFGLPRADPGTGGGGWMNGRECHKCG